MHDWWNHEPYELHIPTQTPYGTTIDGTTAIGLSFIFLAYFLHPAIETAYQRVRAYRAWRAIEKRETVEVTAYPMAEEVLRGRGKWDAARIITVLLVAFSLASWGLELLLGLHDIDEGKVLILNLPPPVNFVNETIDTSSSEVITTPWKVMDPGDIQEDKEAISNIDGDYVNGRAKSRYVIGKDNDKKAVNGKIIVARWSNNVNDTSDEFELFYSEYSSNTIVKSLNCSRLKVDATLFKGNTSWGRVLECDSGPRLTQNSTEQKKVSPPTIILFPSNEDDPHVIVEESSTYPSFMYSVWRANQTDDTETTAVELTLDFYIASTMRLAEAVVTGIVYGGNNATGRGCFELLRRFSTHGNYNNDDDRAAPFGERPTENSSAIPLSDLSEVEFIENGVEVGVTALVCAGFVIVLGLAGFVWSLLLHGSVGMDVYNRDELIRAVSLPGATTDNAPSSAMRIFVRKEDTGNISVVITDTGEKQSGCARILARGAKVAEDDDPAPVAGAVAQQDDDVGDNPVPVGPRTVWLEGIRAGMSRPMPGRNGNFRYPTSVALSASPARSSLGSTAGTPVSRPPSSLLTPKYPVKQNPTMFGGRGASVLFDNGYCSGGGSEKGDNGSNCDDEMECGTAGIPTAAFGGGRGESAEFKGEDSHKTVGAGLRERVGEGGGLEIPSKMFFVSQVGVGEGSPLHSREVAAFDGAHASPRMETTLMGPRAEEHSDNGLASGSTEMPSEDTFPVVRDFPPGSE